MAGVIEEYGVTDTILSASGAFGLSIGGAGTALDVGAAFGSNPECP